MEDAHTTVVSLDDALKTWSFFAVFDGHAGKIAADICSRDLVDKIRTVLTDDVMSVSHFKKWVYSNFNKSAEILKFPKKKAITVILVYILRL